MAGRHKKEAPYGLRSFSFFAERQNSEVRKNERPLPFLSGIPGGSVLRLM